MKRPDSALAYDARTQPPSGGCVLKQKIGSCGYLFERPAAFGRLCVETRQRLRTRRQQQPQPPSGGCVLKPMFADKRAKINVQPPSGGCVLKPITTQMRKSCWRQPPSGGCVLKLTNQTRAHSLRFPAAFGRLCVETIKTRKNARQPIQPPSGGCVLKRYNSYTLILISHPAAFGRLCVETQSRNSPRRLARPAAFGRLCVETANFLLEFMGMKASRLRAAVC